MNTSAEIAWVNCRYFEFWDVPRALTFRYQNRTFLLDDPFEEEEDEYRPSYYVWELSPDVTEEQINTLSWRELEARKVAQWSDLPVKSLVFHRDRLRREGLFFARFHFAEVEIFFPGTLTSAD